MVTLLEMVLPQHSMILELSANGTIVQSLHDYGGDVTRATSHVLDLGDKLLIGSYSAPFLLNLQLWYFLFIFMISLLMSLRVQLSLSFPSFFLVRKEGLRRRLAITWVRLRWNLRLGLFARRGGRFIRLVVSCILWSAICWSLLPSEWADQSNPVFWQVALHCKCSVLHL